MNKLRKATFFLIALLFATTIYSFQRWSGKKALAENAAANLSACQQLKSSIEVLRTNPSLASMEVPSQKELTSLFESSAKGVGIADSSITSIRPEADRRINKTSYVEHSTHVELRQITLDKLAQFLLKITALERRILPTSLRLTAPRGRDSSADSWNVEVVLTYLVFSPESASF